MNLLDFFFPPQCASCNKLMAPAPRRIRLRGGDALCPDCRAEWEKSKLKKCDRCGKAFIDCHCSPKILLAAGCDALIKLCPYGGEEHKTVTSTVFCLKKKANRKCELFLADQLSAPLLKYIKAHRGDNFCVTSVPRREKGILNYGYDHAEVLAKKVAKLCGLPYFQLIERVSDGSEQKNLNKEERRFNVEKAFELTGCAEKARGMSVILVDDVVTTGSSMAVCSSCLRNGGFTHITAAAIARAVIHDKK